jgi:hypothetical protein
MDRIAGTIYIRCCLIDKLFSTENGEHEHMYINSQKGDTL